MKIVMLLDETDRKVLDDLSHAIVDVLAGQDGALQALRPHFEKFRDTFAPGTKPARPTPPPSGDSNE